MDMSVEYVSRIMNTGCGLLRNRVNPGYGCDIRVTRDAML